MHRVSGLETWFSLPGRTAPAPPKWKMFAGLGAGIYSCQLVFNLVLQPLALAAGAAHRARLGAGDRDR